MSEFEPDPRELLEQARRKGRTLLAQLLADQADVERNPPALPADQLAEGRAALENAIASARRMCEALDAAAAIDDEDRENSDERDDT